MVAKTTTAIQRAKKLEQKYKNWTGLEHEKSPLTLVHHLVLELLKYGKKEI